MRYDITSDPGKLIMALCVIVFFAGGIYWAYRDSTKRTAQMQTFAHNHGWDFSSGDKEDLRLRVEPLFPGSVFSLSRIVASGNSGRTIRLFDCQHRIFNRTRSDHFRTGCMMESQGSGGRAGTDAVGILDRNGVDAVWAPEQDQFDWGSPEFSEKFIILAKNRDAAKRVITPALQALLVRYRQKPDFTSLTVAINNAGVVALIGRGAAPETMLELVELCRNIEASIR
jgi:hypothetical protein